MPLSRRLFLTRGSLTLAAASVVSTLPAAPALVSGASSAAPEAEEALSDTDEMDGPLVAQIRDLKTGEMSVYAGEREIVMKDPALAARIFRAAK